MVIRAGLDTTPGVNVSIDAFVGPALAANLPVTIVNHAARGHAFELDDDGPPTHLVGHILSCLTSHTA